MKAAHGVKKGMRPSSAKAKGRRLQTWLASQLQETFDLPTEDVRSTSSGCNGEDVQLSASAREKIPFSFECKNQERVSIWDAWAQAKSNCGAYAPVVVLKKNHSDVLCTVSWDTFKGLMVASRNATGGTCKPAATPPSDTGFEVIEAPSPLDVPHPCEEDAPMVTGNTPLPVLPADYVRLGAPNLPAKELSEWLRALADKVESGD